MQLLKVFGAPSLYTNSTGTTSLDCEGKPTLKVGVNVTGWIILKANLSFAMLVVQQLYIRLIGGIYVFRNKKSPMIIKAQSIF